MQRPEHAPRPPTPTRTTHALASPPAGRPPAPEPPTGRARWSRRAHVTSGPIGPTEPTATQTVIRIAPPRAPSLPLLGDTLAVVFGDPIAYAQARLKQYGPVWQSSYQGQRAVFFVGEDSHRLFARNPVQSDGSRLFACAPAYTILLPFLGQTLLNMDGDQHAAHRRELAPLFSPRYRAAFLQRLNRILGEELVARLRDGGGTLDILPIARRIAFRAGAWLILGLDVDDPRFTTFETLWQDLPPGIFSLTPEFLPASPQTKAKRARRRLNAFLAALMQTGGQDALEDAQQVSDPTVPRDTAHPQHGENDASVGTPPSQENPIGHRADAAPSTSRGEYSQDGKEAVETSRPTVLSLLMALSPEERATLGLADPLAFQTQSCDHALSILFAGIFTTAGIIAWAIAEMARRPDLQARLFGAVETQEQQEEQEEPHPSLTALHPGDPAPAMTAGELKSGAMERAQEGWRVRTDDSPAPTAAPPPTAVALPPYHSAPHAGQLAPTLRPVTLAEASHPYIQALLTANYQRHHIAPAVARLALHDFDYPYVPFAHAAIPKPFRIRTRATTRPSPRRSNDHTTKPPQRLYHIPKGVLAVALSGATQQLPDYFGEAGGNQAQFDPDRFFVHHADRMHPHALFQFGGGEHRCLGSAFADLEIAATLIQLARTCTFALPTGAPFPSAVYLPSNQPRTLAITYQRRDAAGDQSVSLVPSPASSTSAAVEPRTPTPTALPRQEAHL